MSNPDEVQVVGPAGDPNGDDGEGEATNLTPEHAAAAADDEPGPTDLPGS